MWPLRREKREAGACSDMRDAEASLLQSILARSPRDRKRGASSDGAERGRRAGDDEPALAGVLRAVERLVCALEDRDRVVLRLQLRDPRGEIELSRLADRPRRNRLLDPVIQLVGIAERRLGEDHRKLV